MITLLVSRLTLMAKRNARSKKQNVKKPGHSDSTTTTETIKVLI